MYWNSTFLTDNPRCQSLRSAVALPSNQFICNSFWNAQITKPPMAPMAQTPKKSAQGCVSKYCNYWQEPQKGDLVFACSCLLFGLLLCESREIFHTVWSCTPLAAWISESQALASTTFKLARLSRLLCDCHHTYYGPWNDQIINYNGGIHTVAVSTHRTETPFFICLGTLKGGKQGSDPRTMLTQACQEFASSQSRPFSKQTEEFERLLTLRRPSSVSTFQPSCTCEL